MSFAQLLRSYRPGPGVLVAAAFIGPGTVTTATLTGANYGYALGWGIVFSVLATLVLQEMAARLGVVGGVGLGEALRQKLPTGAAFLCAAALVVAAVFVGNSAYEGGNLAGAVLGLTVLPGGEGLVSGSGARQVALLLLAAIAGALLYAARPQLLRRALTATVLVMTLAYVYALLQVDLDVGAALLGLLPFRLPTGAELTVMALIGTTVVPYNLFLHASAARDHYVGSADTLAHARFDTYVSVLLGGFVTLAIATVSAATVHSTAMSLTSATQLAAPLTSVLGEAGVWVLGLGYLAAGLSSAITAPLAAAYALAGLFGWTGGQRDWRFRLSWVVVLGTGLLTSLIGAKPVALIFLAQVANGVLLPVIAGFLVWAVNDRQLLGKHVNSSTRNAAGELVVLVTLLLAGRSLYNAFG